MKRMKQNVALLVAALICALAATAPAAVAAVPIVTVVMVGGVLSVPAPGVARAEVTPPDAAAVSLDADRVTITGLRPGLATLVLTTSEGIEARRLEVVPADRGGQTLVGAGGCLAAGSAIATDPSHLVLDDGGVHIALSPGEWDVAWQTARVRLAASSALGSPLGALGVPPALGVEAEWGDHWDLTATREVGLLDYRMPFPFGLGTLTFGGSTRGLVGEATVAPVKGVTFSGVALMPPSGQTVVGAASTGVDLGPLTLAYATGPAGGSPALDLHAGPVTVSAVVPPGQGATLGVSLALGRDGSIQGSWTPQVGWNAQLAVSLGPSGAAGSVGSGPGAGSGTPASCAGGSGSPTG